MYTKVGKIVKEKWRDILFYFSRELKHPLTYPDYVMISVTNRCNLRCKTCDVYNLPNDNELTLDEIKRIIDQIKKNFPLSIVVLSGGEIFVREDIFEILRYICLNNLKVDLSTNATLLNESKIKEIIRNKVHFLCISLDGATPEAHDSIRGSGTFSKVLQVLRLINNINTN